MELWRELLIGGLQNPECKLDNIDDKALKEIVMDRCYKILVQIKKVIDDEKMQDKDCFI